jgi:UTP--glucose-1-phosphate uridylyltransferase
VEKPKIGEAPSRYAIMGRYVLRPEIFEILENIPRGKDNELQLTDAINELNKKQAVIAFNFEGRRYDIGNKIGFVLATIDFALQRKDIREEVIAYFKDLDTKENLQIIKRDLE